MGAAIKLYREAVPDAGPGEPNDYVFCLWLSLRAQYPDKFLPPPLSLATLNWKAMLFCAVNGIVLLGVSWAILPPSPPTRFVAQIACGLLFGLAVNAGLRVRSLWKRMLLLLPALAATVLLEAFLSSPAGSFFAPARSVAAYFGGFFFGILLMVSGFTKPRRQSRLKA